MAEAGIECREAALEDIPVLVDLMAEFHAESGHGLERPASAAAFAALLRDPARGCGFRGPERRSRRQDVHRRVIS